MKPDSFALQCFAADVAQHELTVLHDDGLYRHLRFAKPGTGNKAFTIVTWPGRLCFCGDMGTFVFQRIDDMLQFFRHDAPNFGYWAEKCVAHDRSGVRAYDADEFRRAVNELAAERLEDETPELRAAVLEALEERVLYRADDEHDARRALAEFEEKGVGFSDTWELTFEIYTFRFTWCCQALVHAVKAYDAQRAQRDAAVPA